MLLILRSLLAWFRGGVRVSDLRSIQARGTDANDLVGRLPRGHQREAAWVAYALQTYGDKLIDACRTGGLVAPDTAWLAQTSFELAEACLRDAQPERATRAAVLPAALPRWSTPWRTHEQLIAMRETLEDLRTYLAYELHTEHVPADEESLDQLAAIDAKLASVDLIWIERPSAELRGGIASTLAIALDAALQLGRRLSA